MKVVGNTLYVHKSNIKALPDWAHARFIHSVEYIDSWKWDILSICKEKISFIRCPEFNAIFEPTVGSRLVLDYNNGTLRESHQSETNPQIFHRRHLFVADDYTGFDVELDKQRVKSWEVLQPDTNRMGRRLWWEMFLEQNNLEKNF